MTASWKRVSTWILLAKLSIQGIICRGLGLCTSGLHQDAFGSEDFGHVLANLKDRSKNFWTFLNTCMGQHGQLGTPPPASVESPGLMHMWNKETLFCITVTEVSSNIVMQSSVSAKIAL